MASKSSDCATSEEAALPDAALIYITEKRYPEGCSDTKKRAIRKKANSFVVRDGVMFFLKKRKIGVRTAW